MLGISDDHIITHRHEEDDLPRDLDGIRLSYNPIDPTVIRDGVSNVTVDDKGDEYRILFEGYLAGLLRVERAGVAELGEELLAAQGELPRWLVDLDTISAADRPWWIPEMVDLDPHLKCDQCGARTPATSIVAPGYFADETAAEYFCEDCWESIDD